jgi:hypothetical protein
MFIGKGWVKQWICQGSTGGHYLWLIANGKMPCEALEWEFPPTTNNVNKGE